MPDRQLESLSQTFRVKVQMYFANQFIYSSIINIPPLHQSDEVLRWNKSTLHIHQCNHHLFCFILKSIKSSSCNCHNLIAKLTEMNKYRLRNTHTNTKHTRMQGSSTSLLKGAYLPRPGVAFAEVDTISTRTRCTYFLADIQILA